MLFEVFRIPFQSLWACVRFQVVTFEIHGSFLFGLRASVFWVFFLCLQGLVFLPPSGKLITTIFLLFWISPEESVTSHWELLRVPELDSGKFMLENFSVYVRCRKIVFLTSCFPSLKVYFLLHLIYEPVFKDHLNLCDHTTHLLWKNIIHILKRLSTVSARVKILILGHC